MTEKLFRVRWEINLEAPTPADAARLALAIQRDPESVATFFEVRRIRLDGTKGKRHVTDTRDLPDNVEVDACAPDKVIWVVSEPEPEPKPEPEPPTTGRPRSEDDFFVVDGVVYERSPELSPLSCDGCVAKAQDGLCRALSGNCFARDSIWKLAGENAALRYGKLYKAVERGGCTGCACAGGKCLPDPCGPDARADGRSVIWVEVKK